MSFKTLFLVGFNGLAICAFIGCGDKESIPTAPTPISAANVDTNALTTAICESDCDEALDSVFSEAPELVFDGVIENGDVKTGQVKNDDDVSIVEFTLEKDAEVTVTVDGESDIFFLLIEVINNGTEFTVVGDNDDDGDSPVDGYDDRSQEKMSLKKGRYLVVIGTWEMPPEQYRLQVEWM